VTSIHRWYAVSSVNQLPPAAKQHLLFAPRPPPLLPGLRRRPRFEHTRAIEQLIREDDSSVAFNREISKR
jgi:hypothetical protein